MAQAPPQIKQARDGQDLTALNRLAADFANQATSKPTDAGTQYVAALANSALAEVAMEVRDKNQARSAAETGMKAAARAIAIDSRRAEHHRIMGVLCGQAAAAIGGLTAFKHGKCALDEMNQALELDPKSSANYLSRGVGNYYLPATLGGGTELAIADFRKAISLDSNNADAYLWLGLALRKAGQEAEAHQTLEKAVKLNPARAWTKLQLAKTP